MFPAQADQVLVHIRASDAFGNDVVSIQAAGATVLVDESVQVDAVPLRPNAALGRGIDDMDGLSAGDVVG